MHRQHITSSPWTAKLSWQPSYTSRHQNNTTRMNRITDSLSRIPCQPVFCRHGWQTSEEWNRGENLDTAQNQELETRHQALTERDCLSVLSLVQGTPTTSDIPRYVIPLRQLPTVTKTSVKYENKFVFTQQVLQDKVSKMCLCAMVMFHKLCTVFKTAQNWVINLHHMPQHSNTELKITNTQKY